MSIFTNTNWGLNAHPSDAPAHWGARAILDSRQPKNPIDLLPDRQGGGGDLFPVLASLLDAAGGMAIAQARVYALLNNHLMSSHKAELFTLIDTDMVKMVANTNASSGYLYLSAWLKPETFNVSDAKWSGTGSPPEPGDHVRTSVWKEEVTVLSNINLHGHRFLTFLTGRKPAGLDSLRRWSRPIMKNDKQVASNEHPSATDCLSLPYLAVGLTVGHELR